MTIEAKLSSIYDAAHTKLPGQASRFASNAQNLADALGPAVAEMRRCGAGELASSVDMLGEELFMRLRIMVRTMNDCALALDAIADDYLAADETAADWARNNQKWLDEYPDIGDRPKTPDLPRLPDTEVS